MRFPSSHAFIHCSISSGSQPDSTPPSGYPTGDLMLAAWICYLVIHWASLEGRKPPRVEAWPCSGTVFLPLCLSVGFCFSVAVCLFLAFHMYFLSFHMYFCSCEVVCIYLDVYMCMSSGVRACIRVCTCHCLSCVNWLLG